MRAASFGAFDPIWFIMDPVREVEMTKKRRDSEPPEAVVRWKWRYHHIGIPTNKPKAGETYFESYGLYVSGFGSSPFGIEWMRFEEGCPVSELIRTIPHIAFEVDDLDVALAGLGIKAEVTSPSRGVRVAMIIQDGAPVELIEFRKAGRKKLT
jgi:hypothetical protein